MSGILPYYLIIGKDDANVARANTDSLTTMDGVHYDPDSLKALGEAFLDVYSSF